VITPEPPRSTPRCVELVADLEATGVHHLVD
jgi:hypothetical protein